MVKQKIAAIAAAAIAACSISATAFADLGYFGPTTLMKANGAATSSEKKKTDLEDAVVNVTSGLTGDHCVTFRVRRYESNDAATGAYYIFNNGKTNLSYLTGKASLNSYYYLKYELPDHKFNKTITSIQVSGKWEP